MDSLQTLGWIALAVVAGSLGMYLAVRLAVQHALHRARGEWSMALRRQEQLLRDIATSTEYVADVADAWAETEADRRGLP